MNNITPPEIDFRDLRTFGRFAQESNGVFTVPALRWIRFNAERFGFADAFVTVRRRVLIHVPRFNACLAAGRPEPGTAPGRAGDSVSACLRRSAEA
jgi:hypothetical protein